MSKQAATTTQRKSENAAHKRWGEIKAVLDKLYEKYNHHRLIKPDPLQFMYRYSKPADMEIAAFIASSLAYGRVQQIEKSLELLFEFMGKSPFEFVRNFDRHKRARLKNFKHRFTSGDDISDLLELFKTVLDQFGSLENFFASGYSKDDKTIIPALTRFCDSLSIMHAQGHKGKPSDGLSYLLASPSRGSACKRLNLFLRWVVRNDDVDAGLWKTINPGKLVVPVDVHMGRLCRILDLYSRKTVSLSTALEITESFAAIEPGDPVKYDFALSRIGIVENCDGRARPACADCKLLAFCRRREYYQAGPEIIVES